MKKRLAAIWGAIVAFLFSAAIFCSQCSQSFAAVPSATKVTAKNSKDNGWEHIKINQYDVAVIWVTDEPESYYIIDARADLCFFVVAYASGVSITKIPCAPFVEKVNNLDDRFDKCQ